MSMPVYGSESVKTKPAPVNDHRRTAASASRADDHVAGRVLAAKAPVIGLIGNLYGLFFGFSGLVNRPLGSPTGRPSPFTLHQAIHCFRASSSPGIIRLNRDSSFSVVAPSVICEPRFPEPSRARM